MAEKYGPILIFTGIAVAFPIVTLWIGKLIRPTSDKEGAKVEPYECGIVPETGSRGRYSVRFYIIAILFVIFDVEVIFLFPWAVQFRALGLFGLIEMFIFLGILILGYVWIWKKRALEWV